MPFGPGATAFLAACVFFAGVVDALAGGGGLITLPAYLAVGLDPALVLGTNKFGSSIGTAVATVRFHRALKFALVPFLPVIAASALSAWVGARLAVLIDPSWIRPLLLCALPLVAWTVWASKGFGVEDSSHRHTQKELTRRSVLVAAPIGAYDGFFGPGTGTFFALALTRYAHYDLLGATARAKVLNLISNVGALIAFALAGRIHWRVGLLMAAMSVAGNFLGSHLGVKKGAAAIRPVVVLVCAGLFVKVLLDALRS